MAPKNVFFGQFRPTFGSNNSADRAATPVAKKTKDADNYHYFTHDNKGGITGVAYLGTVCSSQKQYRSAISEWLGAGNNRYSELQCMLVSYVFHNFPIIYINTKVRIIIHPNI